MGFSMKQTLSLFVLTVLLAALTACAGVGSSPPPAPNPTPTPTPTPTPPPPPSGSLQTSINHIVIMLQENRSFDHYFGAMTQYRTANNIPINSSDGKINDLSQAVGYKSDGIAPYHTGSVCTEDLSPDWEEHHIDINSKDPAAASPTNFDMAGFVPVARGESQFFANQNPPILLADQTGKRAMGFFDDTQLNYYYFMASNFGMSDNLHSPLPSNTPANRMFIHAATSQGWAHRPQAQLNAKTIWQELDAAGISWKIYVTDFEIASRFNNFKTYLDFFTYWNQIGTAGQNAHVVSLKDYFTDVANGTLPSVSFIEAGYFSGKDEHTSNINPALGKASPESVQVGAKAVEQIINALMASPSWKDSIFLFGFDEGGGAFDHAPPVAVPSPDGIKPRDLIAGKDVPGDFTMTGTRIPNMVISPFSKKNFVSHTPMDYTAFLKLIETRFGLPPLTQRDASMPDMTEFFDFSTATGPWGTPPDPTTIPVQRTDGVCNFSKE
jgi:phospholipase C